MRYYKRKTERGRYSKDVMEAAADAVVKDGLSIRKSGSNNEVNYKTLSRYIPVYKANNNSLKDIQLGYTSHRQVLSKIMENSLAEYVKKAEKIFHGITITDLRKLAYQMALANKVTYIPPSWTKHEMAGSNWARGFLIRNNTISLRTAEATSIQRMANFNQHNVKTFMDNHENVLSGNPAQVMSCLRCKYSAVKHISTNKAWNKQHRLGERRLKQSLNQAQSTLNDCQVLILQVKHKTWVQNETKKQKCAQ